MTNQTRTSCGWRNTLGTVQGRRVTREGMRLKDFDDDGWHTIWYETHEPSGCVWLRPRQALEVSEDGGLTTDDWGLRAEDWRLRTECSDTRVLRSRSRCPPIPTHGTADTGSLTDLIGPSHQLTRLQSCVDLVDSNMDRLSIRVSFICRRLGSIIWFPRGVCWFRGVFFATRATDWRTSWPHDGHRRPWQGHASTREGHCADTELFLEPRLKQSFVVSYYRTVKTDFWRCLNVSSQVAS